MFLWSVASKGMSSNTGLDKVEGRTVHIFTEEDRLESTARESRIASRDM